jgi:hypothetical protein
MNKPLTSIERMQKVTLVAAIALAGCSGGQGSDKSPGGSPAMAEMGGAPNAESANLEKRGRRHKHGIVGAWLVRDPTDPTFGALSTYTSDGQFIASPAALNVTAAHGVWVPDDDCDFVVTSRHIRRSPTNTFAGTIHHRVCVTLEDENTFTAVERTQAFDADGNLVATLPDEQRSGTRISPEPF